MTEFCLRYTIRAIIFLTFIIKYSKIKFRIEVLYMDDIIDQVLKIEDMAQAVMAQAKEKQSRMDSSVDEEAEKLKIELKKELEKKRAEIKAGEDERAENKLAQIRSAHEKAAAALEEKFSAYRDEWIEEIFGSITAV